jgi:hypothetical protein
MQDEGVERAFGDLRHGEHPLGRLRLGGAPELEGGYLHDVDGPLAERGKQGGAARGVGQLRGDEHSAQREWRPKELLDGADALGGEQPLALARFPAPEVAC